MKLFDLEVFPGLMSPKECCESMQKICNNMLIDQTSTFINSSRATTLKVLADLFLEYNKVLKGINDDSDRGDIT